MHAALNSQSLMSVAHVSMYDMVDACSFTYQNMYVMLKIPLLHLTLSLLQAPIGDCLLQRHRHQSATCRQNATAAAQPPEAEK